MLENHLDINELRERYARNENITKYLTQKGNIDREEVIEIAYDIQTGSYTKIALDEPDELKRYAEEINTICSKYIFNEDSILDCGAGELTTISALSQHLPRDVQLLACDISLSRLRAGRQYAQQYMRSDLLNNLKMFVADIGRMPLADNSVDVVFTCHALEPNHGREGHIIKELTRIARRHLILFEPSWENATKSIRDRMEEHGYVRDLPRYIKEAGGRLITTEKLPHPLVHTNPTYGYIVEVGNHYTERKNDTNTFQCPRSGFKLGKYNNYWWSKEGGWAYPEIDNISCLRVKQGILMSNA